MIILLGPLKLQNHIFPGCLRFCRIQWHAPEGNVPLDPPRHSLSTHQPRSQAEEPTQTKERRGGHMSGPATAKTAACTTIRDCHGLLVCVRATHSGYHSPAPHTARTAPRSRAGEHAQHRVRRAARAPLPTVNVAAYTTTGGRLGLGVCVKAIHENPPGA